MIVKPSNSSDFGKNTLEPLANAETIRALFFAILNREVGDEEFLKANDGKYTVYYWADRLAKSEEFRRLFLRKHDILPREIGFAEDPDYRSPSLTAHVIPSAVLLTGSCLLDGWQNSLEREYPNTMFRFQTSNNASELEHIPDHELREINFQIIQIPLRAVIPESEYFSLTLSETDKERLQEVFDASLYRLKRILDSSLKYNRAMGLPAFVLNFGAPQANPLGFLMPKFDLTNFAHFIRQLNRALSEMVVAERSVFLVDYDEISSALGKRFIQDDVTSHANHGSFIGGTPEFEEVHLTPLGIPENLYGAKKHQAALAIFKECIAFYNILLPDNKIKIVIFDLDGTLWRGVPADRDDLGGHLIEGWPLSILEAAAFLKKRGILLAIASKNDPENAKRIWERLYGSIFPLSNFAVTKFSWAPKTNSIEEILQETNLLPGNCLFVDDNPIEREQVQLAFPRMKIISGPIFTWRRTLLWAPELQTSIVTNESVERTRSIQGVIHREGLKRTLNEDEYIRQLAVRVEIETVNHVEHRRFQRAFELLNKTNQFNTTGRRWSQQEISKYFEEGGCMFVADVSDRLASYGLIPTALTTDRHGPNHAFRWIG